MIAVTLRFQPILIAFFLSFAAMFGSDQASAQSCSMSVDNVNFGTVDLTSNSAYNTTAAYTISCTGGGAGQPILACPNLGAGSGGANGANAPRYLASSGNQIGYNLYSDAGRTTVWGAYTGGGTVPEIQITLDNQGDGSASGTIYGQVHAGQQSAPTGSYSSTFSGAPNASLSWAVDVGQTCTTVGAANATPFSFTASANYVAACTLAVTSMNFGTMLTLASPVDATSTVTATCSASSPYSIKLNDGMNSVGPQLRQLGLAGINVPYALYKDAARTLIWGNTPATQRDATGAGTSQAYTVYGRIPAQSTPPAGTYTDTVIVTVSF